MLFSNVQMSVTEWEMVVRSNFTWSKVVDTFDQLKNDLKDTFDQLKNELKNIFDLVIQWSDILSSSPHSSHYYSETT